MNNSTSFLSAYQPQDEVLTTPHLSIAHKHPLKSIRREKQFTKITTRELEVLHLIAYEYSSKEIASKLYISYETVNSHRKNIMVKLGVKNTAGMVRVGFELGLLDIT